MFTEKLKRFPLVRLFYRLSWVRNLYHLLLGFLGAFSYGFPSRRMVVIGVTGTKGKTTVSNLIAQILDATGSKTGLATTVNFKTGDKEWVNDTKQTMLGRFRLQKLLSEMRRSGCTYAVIETSSEGILQYRHRFIDYRVAVFTNLSPEHIERHGGFEKYRAAKVELFKQVARRGDGVGVYNLDDENAKYFLEPSVKTKYGYTLGEKKVNDSSLSRTIAISNVKLSQHKTEFEVAGVRFELPLIGRFNVHNAAAAICVALSQSISLERSRDVLRTARQTPGRFEVVDMGQPFTVVIDYAHEPASLKALYSAVRLFHPNRIIGVLGSQGGGRDVWKRKEMGRIAAEYCDSLFLTNEDPYDEPPMEIIKDIEQGVLGSAKSPKPTVYKVVDRREAIYKAISLASAGDAVVLTGKGGEVWMCVEKGKKILWNEREIVEQLFKKMGQPSTGQS